MEKSINALVKILTISLNKRKKDNIKEIEKMFNKLLKKQRIYKI